MHFNILKFFLFIVNGTSGKEEFENYWHKVSDYKVTFFWERLFRTVYKWHMFYVLCMEVLLCIFLLSSVS